MQLLVLLIAIVGMIFAATMYLDQASSITLDNKPGEQQEVTPGSGISNILNSAHTAADQMQPKLEE